MTRAFDSKFDLHRPLTEHRFDDAVNRIYRQIFRHHSNMTLQTATVLLIVTAICSGFVFAMDKNGQDTATEYTLEINERDTKFTERVEVDVHNALIYHVPAHNDVDQSDVLIASDQMLSVTRIPRMEECHVEDIEEDESSPQKVLMDIAKLKFIYKGKPVSVRTIQKTVIKYRRFLTRNPVITKFCGSFPIFKMAVIEIQDSDNKGHPIKKRSNKKYLEMLRFLNLGSINGEEDKPTNGPTADDDGDDDDDNGSSSSGNLGVDFASGSDKSMYYDYSFPGNCKRLEYYNVDNCIESPKRWNFTAVPTSSTCMYQVQCRTMKIVDGKSVPGECRELHRRSREICYDFSCKSSLA